MRLSDLQNKDVVNVITGNKIGNVIDVEITDNGVIERIILYDKKKIFSFSKNSDEVIITWDEIKKIGVDVILVDKK